MSGDYFADGPPNVDRTRSENRQDTPPASRQASVPPERRPRQVAGPESGGACPQPDGHDTPATSPLPSAHVVLYQPEIPQNTGNVGRTCVAVGAKLWIVRPAGFRIDDARVRRAGLDYWQHLDLGDAANWDDLLGQLAPRRMFFLSRFARRTVWEAEFAPQDVFVFGRETSGLPASILDPHDPRSLRLPTSAHVRSLNLATTVGIVLYEHQRQLSLRGATRDAGNACWPGLPPTR